MEAAFKLLDKNGDGALSRGELNTALKICGAHAHGDGDDLGHEDVRPVLGPMSAMRTAEEDRRQSELSEVCQQLDGHDKRITMEEFRAYFEQAGPPAPKEAPKEVGMWAPTAFSAATTQLSRSNAAQKALPNALCVCVCCLLFHEGRGFPCDAAARSAPQRHGPARPRESRARRRCRTGGQQPAGAHQVCGALPPPPLTARRVVAAAASAAVAAASAAAALAAAAAALAAAAAAAGDRRRRQSDMLTGRPRRVGGGPQDGGGGGLVRGPGRRAEQVSTF